jgi:hypothetical protein
VTRQEEATKIQTALTAARRGGASVSQLAEAHTLAEKHQLANVTADLRRHLRALIPDPNNGRVSVSRSFTIGVASGLMTWILVWAFTHRKQLS